MLCRTQYDFDVSVPADEALKFERIAASLLSKLHGVKDTGDDILLEDEESWPSSGLVEFGTADVAQSSGRTSHKPDRDASNASSSTGSTFMPRNRRRLQIPSELLPRVAIVGRPNVGKSALFNRLAGSSVAVVYDYPGVTRDRLYTRAFWGDKEFMLIDTGGLMSDASQLPPEVRESAVRSISAAGLPSAIERQAAAGVAEAHTVVLVVDGQAGVQPGDEEILGWLRTRHPDKKVLLAVNKCESSQRSAIMASEFWELGLEPLPVSAISGSGTGELLDALTASLPLPALPAEREDPDSKPLAVAIIGRPNVGKSSLLNAISGAERSIVCDMSGTTRDAVDTDVTLRDGRRLTLIDTAGIRKRAAVAASDDGAEQLSVDRAVRAVRRADIGLLVVDGGEGVTQQDFRLSEVLAKEGRAVVVVVNKWDKVDTERWTKEKYLADVRAQLRHVSWANIVAATSSNSQGVGGVIRAVFSAGEEHRRRVSTATLNLVLRDATAWKAPPSQRGNSRRGRIYYATQAATRPPTFVFFVNDVKLFSDDYRKYMERQLRDNIGFPGTPLRLLWRGKPERERPARGSAGGAEPSATSRGSGSRGRGDTPAGARAGKAVSVGKANRQRYDKR